MTGVQLFDIIQFMLKLPLIFCCNIYRKFLVTLSLHKWNYIFFWFIKTFWSDININN